MKKLLILLFVLIGQCAIADNQAVDQQYVEANQPSQPQLQAPFGDSQANQQPQQQAEQQANNNPMNIYVSPSQQQNTDYSSSEQNDGNQMTQNNNQMPQQNNEQQSMNSQSQNYAYNNQQQTNNNPQMNQPVTNQNNDSGWQTRPDETQPQQNSSQAMPQQNDSFQPEAQPQSQSNSEPNQPANDNMNPVPTNQVNEPQSDSPTNATINNGAYGSEAQQSWFDHCIKSVTDPKMQPYAQAFCECGWQKISDGGLAPSLLTSKNPADIQKANEIIRGISQICLVQVMSQQGN